MAVKFKPHAYQHEIIEFETLNQRCAVFAGMGLGKTVSTLTMLDALELIEPGPTLVIAPKRVAQSTWPDEAAKWEHLRNIEVSAVVGSLDERLKALRKPANVYTTNYEQIPWLVEKYGEKWPFKKIVSDESTRLKGFRIRQGSKRSYQLARVAHCRASRFIELTGTPSPNGLKDLWGQMWFLDKGKRLGSSFKAFEERWFQSIQVGDDAFARELRPLPFAQDEIQGLLRDICISLDPRDYFHLKDPIVRQIKVPLPKKARQLYEDMEREMFMQIGETDVEAFTAAAKSMKCLQLASGSVWVDAEKGTWAAVHDAKLQALESILEEAAGMPLLVRYHWVPSREQILKAFKGARMLDDNPQTIRDWNAGKIPILVAHAQSCGHGLNLQDGSNIYVEFDGWWDLEHYQQITERIGPTRQAQSGHNRNVFHYHIIAEGTVDSLVMARLAGKRSVQDLLLEAMKRRKAR